MKEPKAFIMEASKHYNGRIRTFVLVWLGFALAVLLIEPAKAVRSGRLRDMQAQEDDFEEDNFD